MDSEQNEAGEKIFIFEKSYFSDPDFIARFDHDIKRLRTYILYGKNREHAKATLNAFMNACLVSISDEATRIHMHLEFYLTLAFYGEMYSSHQTFENILSDFEKPEHKEKLFGKRPMRSCVVYAEVLLKYYTLKNAESNGWYSSSAFEIITKAKYYILKAYTQSLEGKNKFEKSDQSYSLVLIAACYMHLSRWFEPIFYLEKLKNKDLTDPNYDYLTALNLDALKDKSCLDYNGQLLLKIIQCGTNVIDNPSADPRQKEHVKEITQQCSENIISAKLSLEKLKKHQQKIDASKKKRTAYFKYCIENQLFLNEHSFFCKCGRSIGDTLEIKTSHAHTELPWVAKFERLLDLLIAEFAIARGNLYEATSSGLPKFHFKSENKKKDSLQRKKDAMLKNAFKTCYSILDQIGHGIFEVLEIDITSFLKEKSINERKPIQHLYFLNMWDLFQFSANDFKNNFYLISLFSIAKDLDRNDYAAWKSFKDYRNAMEHKFLIIEEEPESVYNGLKNVKKIKRKELGLKTSLLIILTKSAIISFAYLARRQSKVKELELKQI
jgi:hypothetical protein